LQFYYWNTVFL